MRKLFETMGELFREKRGAVLVLVIASRGSVPRGPGARMLVTDRGRVWGTIGGGAVEYEAQRRAQALLAGGGAGSEVFRLYPNQVKDIGMVCGGEVEVWFRCFPAGDRALVSLSMSADRLFNQGRPFWLVCDVTEGGEGSVCLYQPLPGITYILGDIPLAVQRALGPRPAIIEAEGRRWFAERMLSPERVFIFGGGHVSQALVPVLAAAGFRCIVLEDRAEFCRAELFPGAEAVQGIDMACISDTVSVTAEDYAVIMTRGHKDDLLLQAQILDTPARYIGVIGSRKKRDAVFAQLRERGFTDADLARITTPIGLPIGAETPAEIAVSIAAQLIQIRASQWRNQP